MIISKKITIGGINGVRGGFKGITERTRVATIFGLARTYVTKLSENMGTSYGFVGEFSAMNREGERFVSPMIYVPEPVQSSLKGAIDVTDGNQAIELAFDIFVVPSDNSPVGYVLECASLIDMVPSDTMAALSHRVVGSRLALEAAKPDPTNLVHNSGVSDVAKQVVDVVKKEAEHKKVK